MTILAAVMAIGIVPAHADAQAPPSAPTTLSTERVNDAIAGGWLGAIVAAPWGYPLEFAYMGRMVPAKKVPRYRVSFTNKFTYGGNGSGARLKSAADETYVEIPLIDALYRYGLQADWVQLGQPFAESQFPLFFANLAGRRNLQAGIPPPASGSPAFNAHSDDIDFQIESDFIGLATPAQPGAAIDLAWRLGHIMNYGDGVYGGVMVAAMHAAAFRAQSLDEIIAAGQAAVPEGTKYRQMIDDVIAWHQQNPRKWQATWRLLQRNWGHQSHPHPEEARGFNISATLNGSYILLGLLYGNGNFERTIRISMRAGQDTDNNPANAASILGTWQGYKRLPKKFVKGVARNRKISGTDYTLAKAISVNTELAAQITDLRGGSVGAGGWQIPSDVLDPPAFEQLVPGEAAPTISSVDVVKNGQTARFKVNAGAGIRDAWWSFGDFSGAHGQDVSHTYAKPGLYRVNVWVANALGTTTHREQTVTIP